MGARSLGVKLSRLLLHPTALPPTLHFELAVDLALAYSFKDSRKKLVIWALQFM